MRRTEREITYSNKRNVAVMKLVVDTLSCKEQY